jgi:A/G-specific adenine glycosylase
MSARARNWWKSPKPARAFRRALLRWYDANKRDLPWRGERDPYRIWISEIMLQQTRVAAVRERYQGFLRRFPNVRALAKARIDSVLAQWSGLGYYHRARNLHRAAGAICRREDFPRSIAELRELPGIGRYTAAAIASIAFNQPVVAVDGNVERVLGRLLHAAKVKTGEVATALLDRSRPGDFNQAMMDLGATVCLPNRAPQCAICPVARFCASRGEKPLSLTKSNRKKKTAAFVLLYKNDGVLLVRRSATARLMAGMWELPAASPRAGGKRIALRHSITNTDYEVIAYISPLNGSAPANGNPRSNSNLKLQKFSHLGSLPLTGLTRKILARALPHKKIF